jgi:nucleotide-binding universal stress UspA family protein
LIGNVAEKVVRHAPCPVLIVKSRAARRKLGASIR